VPFLSMVDVWQFLHPDQPGITTYHAFGEQPAGPCLDHILIDESVEIIEVAIDARSFNERYPSDHFPIIACLRVYDAKKNPPVVGRRNRSW
jgi:endonuclease/exonuclease/phosphatase family metal-dependent hydrolase